MEEEIKYDGLRGNNSVKGYGNSERKGENQYRDEIL